MCLAVENASGFLVRRSFYPTSEEQSDICRQPLHKNENPYPHITPVNIKEKAERFILLRFCSLLHLHVLKMNTFITKGDCLGVLLNFDGVLNNLGYL